MSYTDKQELTLDSNAQLGFLSFYRSLPEKSSNIIRLFERNAGDYYSAHGEDAIFIAREFFKTTSVLKSIGAGALSLPSTTLSYSDFETFISDALQNRALKIEIWGQPEPRRNSQWKLIKEASPGNLQHVESSLAEIVSDPVVVAIQLIPVKGELMVGVGLADASDKTLGVIEFIDNDMLTHLESLLVQLNVKECLLSESSNEDTKRLHHLLEMAGIVVTLCKKSHFSTELGLEDLNRLLSEPLLTLPEKPLGLRALNAVAAYLNLLGESLFFHQFHMVEHQSSLFMRLDTHAIEALALVGEGVRKHTHLFGWLNKCLTLGGAQLLNSWIRQPLLDSVLLQLRLDRVELFCQMPTLLDACRSFLSRLPNLSRIGKKLKRKRASLQDVIILYQVSMQLPDLLPTLSIDALLQSFYVDCEECFQNLIPFTTLVERTVDLAAAENHEFMIKACHHESLVQLKYDIEELKSKIEPEMDRVANLIQVEPHKVLKLEHNSQFGYHFRVSLTNSGLIRGKGFTELSTLKSGLLFTTPTLQTLSRKIQNVSQEYDNKQSSLVNDFMLKVETHVSTFLVLSQVLSELDVLCSFAHVSQNAPIPYVKPILVEDGLLELIQCRHPCVEVQDSMEFIPNNIRMERDQSDFLIITGPNMGGKSTYIRQVGIVAVMAQIGCFVPCQSAKLPIFDGILCRIGASDHIAKGVSTFMAEMLETSGVIRAATSRSLVIIDELGRGTSTHDGFGLAYGIAYHLATEVKAFTLFATHFHEITKLSDELASVQNCHVTAQTSLGTLTLLYTVRPGSCDESFGIHAAKLAGIPEDVIRSAEIKLLELEKPGKYMGGLNPTATLQEMEQEYALVLAILSEIKHLKETPTENLHRELREFKAKYAADIEKTRFLKNQIENFSL